MMRLLDVEGITHQEHTYDVSDGLLMVFRCPKMWRRSKVFKTLVTKGDDGNCCICNSSKRETD